MHLPLRRQIAIDREKGDLAPIFGHITPRPIGSAKCMGIRVLSVYGVKMVVLIGREYRYGKDVA